MVNLKRAETLETEHAVKKPSDKDEGKLHVALEKDFDKIGKTICVEYSCTRLCI